MSKFYLGIYSFSLVLVGLLCFFAHQSFNFPGDTTISLWLQEIDLPFFNRTMEAISYIASLIPAIVIVALVSGGLWVSGRKLEPIFIVLLTSLATLISWLLKLLISRPRPGSDLSQLSFPSGHFVYAVVFYGFLFYLAPRLVNQPAVTRVLQSVLIILILLTGVSRISLGAHWPSDILGSLLLGGLLLAPVAVLYNGYAMEDKNA